MTENNAARPGLTDDEIRVEIHNAIGFAFDPGETQEVNAADLMNVAHALLSTLRAEGVPKPVLGHQTDAAADASIKANYVKVFGTTAGWEDYAGSYFIEGYRAALASAPVADKVERQYHHRMPNCTPGRPECREGNGYPECPCWHDVGTGPLKGKEDRATHWRDKPNTPVAGEAFKDECAATGQTCSYGPHGPHGERQCKYCGAAPQASEAVYQIKLPGDTESVWRDSTEAAFWTVPAKHRRIFYAAPQASEAVRPSRDPDLEQLG